MSALTAVHGAINIWKLMLATDVIFKFWVVFFRAFLVFLRIHFSVFILPFKKLFFSELWAIIILFTQLQAVEIIYW
jgi:hypothetical protein